MAHGLLGGLVAHREGYMARELHQSEAELLWWRSWQRNADHRRQHTTGRMAEASASGIEQPWLDDHDDDADLRGRQRDTDHANMSRTNVDHDDKDLSGR
jgi:hypothetical protein